LNVELNSTMVIDNTMVIHDDKNIIDDKSEVTFWDVLFKIKTAFSCIYICFYSLIFWVDRGLWIFGADFKSHIAF
jgi:hypothetical protein